MRWALPDKPSFNWLQTHHKVKQKQGGNRPIFEPNMVKSTDQVQFGKATKGIKRLTTCLTFDDNDQPDDDEGGGGRYVK